MAKKKRKFLKIWSIIVNIIFGIFIFILLVVGFSLIPFKGNYKILTVMSGSMEPKLHVGSLIFDKPSSDYQVNDIITFRPKNTKGSKNTTTHRIVEIIEKDGVKEYKTKGDANNSPDQQTVINDQIIGKVFFSIPWLGYIVGYIRTLPGLILLVIVPATIIIFEESRKIIKEIKKIRRKKAQEQALKSQEAK